MTLVDAILLSGRSDSRRADLFVDTAVSFLAVVLFVESSSCTKRVSRAIRAGLNTLAAIGAAGAEVKQRPPKSSRPRDCIYKLVLQSLPSDDAEAPSPPIRDEKIVGVQRRSDRANKTRRDDRP
ncbi:hypothetical protein EVAR_45859_1 [Eumeta japonica]|uniref:Uncharacterized protein n=1 Tax=Eumeta variegata TaxID=151549 RepID=A0A4C1WNW9_EUMVA|nr:hypothetical protein EVAR_45859_1 [Eumeta japonica]